MRRKARGKKEGDPRLFPLPFSSSHCLLTLAWNRLSYGEVGWLENLKNASDRAKKIIHNLKLSVAAKVCNTSYCDLYQLQSLEFYLSGLIKS